MRLGSILAFAGLAATLAGCGGPKIRSDFDPRFNFSGLQTYAWAERTPEGDDDPRVYNAIVEGRVRTGVDRALAAKGYQLVERDENPTFLVAWHGAIQGRMNIQTISNDYGYGWGGWGRPGYWRWGGPGYRTSTTYVNEWDEGTLVIDIVNPETDELVWRGSIQGKIDERQRNPDEEQARFDKASAEVLATFPPGGALDPDQETAAS